jgi:tetratricopeptide (TPR) repeat protein
LEEEEGERPKRGGGRWIALAALALLVGGIGLVATRGELLEKLSGSGMTPTPETPTRAGDPETAGDPEAPVVEAQPADAAPDAAIALAPATAVDPQTAGAADDAGAAEPAVALAAPGSTAPSAVPDAGASPAAAAAAAPVQSYAELISEANGHIKRSRFRSAQSAFRKALELQPASLEAKEGLGVALVNSDPGRAGYREAVTLLTEVVEADDRKATVWFALGMAHQFSGQRSAASRAYKKYLFLEPAGAFAGEVRAMLGQLE